MTILSRRIFATLIALILTTSIMAQGKYQSLMWKISGHGLSKPSYLYGTMHVSGKLVFHLGDEFYDAIEGVDVVALELEPEAWLDAIFKKENSGWYSSKGSVWYEEEGFGYEYNSSVPELTGKFKPDLNIREKIAQALSNDPVILNYLMFRYENAGSGADFEEDTWLDMHIYQTGKKLGKKTIGLETYEQSDYYIKLSQKAQYSEINQKEYDDQDIEEMGKLQEQFEPAYRREDLDLLDSLNRISTSEAFQKYILIERNKVFIHTIDSVLQSGQSIMAGMGCAHLPGPQGIIEMLRQKGYHVEPYHKGERNTRRRSRIESMTYPRAYVRHNLPDGKLSFATPSTLYYLGENDGMASWITLDIPNGGSFMIDRIKTYSGITGIESEGLRTTLDSILYEAIPGDIVTQKKVVVDGIEGLDILNKTRRGNYQRRIILFAREEILIFKLTATGDRIKAGYGNDFFNSLKLAYRANGVANNWTSEDGSLQCQIPGEITYYPSTQQPFADTDFDVISREKNSNTTYLIMRHTVEDPDFMDEIDYETGRLTEAWCEDFGVQISDEKKLKHHGLPASEVHGTTASGIPVKARFIIHNLDYYAIATFKSDDNQFNHFCNSFTIHPTQHDTFFPYEDTTLYFKSELPFEKQSTESFGYANWQSFSRDEEKSNFEGKSEEAVFSVPGETEMIKVNFQRFHKFSDGENKDDFMETRIELINDSEMKLEKNDIQWNGNDCKVEVIWSDTANPRHQRNMFILHNKSFYTISTSYDSITGPSDFITRFYDAFTPTDTVFAYPHFENRDKPFLEALMSEDSTTRSDAINIIAEMDFAADCAPQIREILNHPPHIQKKEARERVIRKLTSGLQADTSDVNITYIEKLFYANSDSITYQADLLRTLAMMQTSKAEQAFRKLLLDEPPVNSRNNPVGFSYLEDTLELVQKSITEYLQLLSLDDYQYPVYELTAALIDSNLIKPSLYKNDLNMILLEARNELKLLNAKDDDAFSFFTEDLLTLCKLLQPYRNEKDVSAFFAKAYRSKKAELLVDLAEFDYEHQQPVGDSTLKKIFASEKQVLKMIRVLEKNNQSAHIPEKYRDREQLAVLYLRNKFNQPDRNSNGVDSIVVISRMDQTIRGINFDVIYLKYKKNKSKQWLGSIVAFDDTKPELFYPRFIEKQKAVVLDSDEDELAEMNRAYKQLVEMNRRSFNWGGGNSSRYYD